MEADEIRGEWRTGTACTVRRYEKPRRRPIVSLHGCRNITSPSRSSMKGHSHKAL